MIVGVMAVQGDFSEHLAILKTLNVKTQEVRLPKDLEDIDGLIIPGGESTTLRKLFDIYGLTIAIKRYAKAGGPIWGTCAGMILMAQTLTNDRPEPLNLMNITVTRNAYGRQLDSFEAAIPISVIEGSPIPAVFIRAPSFTYIGENVEVIGKLNDGTPVAVKQGNMLATAFHPELTNDVRFHNFFLSLIKYKDNPSVPRNECKDL